MFLAEVQVRQADLAVDHPGRFVPGRQDAQLVRRALALRLAAAEGAGAAVQVAGQGVVARGVVVAGVVAVVPDRRDQPVAELRAVLQAGMRRLVHRLENLQLIDGGHGALLQRVHSTCARRACQPCRRNKRKNLQAAGGLSRKTGGQCRGDRP
ncbi:hypothetical protein FQZ97_1107390 [compost metagenome]